MGQSNEGDDLASILEWLRCACGCVHVQVDVAELSVYLVGLVISSLVSECRGTAGLSAEGSWPVIMVTCFYYTTPVQNVVQNVSLFGWIL